MSTVIVNREYTPAVFFLTRIINGVIGLIGVALVLRFLLELLDANPASPFIGWVYRNTNVLIDPFIDAFPWLSFGKEYATEVTILIALIGYALIAWFVSTVLSFIFTSFN